MTAAGYHLTVTDTSPTIVTVVGEIDVTNATEFAGEIEKLPPARPTIVDFSDLRYLDSAGFAALSDILAARPVAIVIPADSPVRRAAALMSVPIHASVNLARDALT